MLVLTRKLGEEIVVNNNITIKVVEIRGDKIKLGFEAPREVPIHRKEIQNAIEAPPKKDNDSVPAKVRKPKGARKG